jgi:uncharacterized protein YciI
MQFMYVLELVPHYRHTDNWTDDANRIVGEHFNYLKNLHEKGVMKLVGKTDYDVSHNENRGYAIFEAENEEAAKVIMNNDPCLLKGVMTATLFPFRIALY